MSYTPGRPLLPAPLSSTTIYLGSSCGILQIVSAFSFMNMTVMSVVSNNDDGGGGGKAIETFKRPDGFYVGDII